MRDRKARARAKVRAQADAIAWAILFDYALV
jgi:hypothetical protein